MPFIQLLLTFINKQDDEILSFLKQHNFQGNILVAVSREGEETEKVYSYEGAQITIFGHKNPKSASAQRNFLLRKATATYITFGDNDTKLLKEAQETLSKFIENNNFGKEVAIRFLIKSEDENVADRFKDTSNTTEGFKSLNELRRHGCVGIIFNREFLLENNLFFNEEVGPGTSIYDGEDFLFNYTFLKKGKIYQSLEELFSMVFVETSQKTRPLEEHAVAKGYVYQKVYGFKGRLYVIHHLLKHRKSYLKGYSIFRYYRFFSKGYKKAKRS